MKTKKRLLITCAGGSASLYHANVLKQKYQIFFADADANSVARHAGFPFARLPFGSDPTFVQTLSALVKRWKIEIVVPGADEELLPVAKFITKHPPLQAIIPSQKFIQDCLDKKHLMEILQAKNISSLRGFASVSKIKYPALVKPIFGRGSRGVHRIQSTRELKGYLDLYHKKFSEILVQPYIEGDEYTISVIVNNKNQLIGIVPKLVLLKRGITRAAVTKRHAAIEGLCKKIVKEMQPAGPFNVQLKFWQGASYIFEINPRLSTTSVLTDKAFGNEIDLCVQYHDQPRLSKLPKMKSGVYLYRYEENIFQSRS